MRTLVFILFTGLACWRIGNFVDWQVKTITDKLSNDFERPYKIPVDECAVGREVSDHSTLIYSGSCSFKSYSNRFKSAASRRIQQYLPSPHSELIMGMVLGENQFKFVPTYNDVLKEVGLVHVVVVSGYNISLVFTLLIRVLGSQYKLKNLIVGLFVTLMYAGISGFGIPSVRAWIMGSIAVLFKFYGRPSQGVSNLILSAIIIIVCAPEQLFSLSFQLSFMATLGVMLLPEVFSKFVKWLGVTSSSTILQDFITSLSAQVAVNPILSYYFGTVSIAALITNPLVLWVVPICTILGGLLVFLVFVSPLLSQLLVFILYPFLDYFVTFSELFAGFNSASVNLNFQPYMFVIYYGFVYLAVRIYGRNTR